MRTRTRVRPTVRRHPSVARRRATPRYPTLARPAPSRSRRRSSTLPTPCALSLLPLVRHSRIPPPPRRPFPSAAGWIMLPFHQMAAERASSCSPFATVHAHRARVYECQASPTARTEPIATRRRSYPSTPPLSSTRSSPTQRERNRCIRATRIRVFVCIYVRDRDGERRGTRTRAARGARRRWKRARRSERGRGREGASGNERRRGTNSLSLDSITFNRLARGQCYYPARSSQSAE